MISPVESGDTPEHNQPATNVTTETKAESTSPSGGVPADHVDDDEVTKASMESFPASDPPAWTHNSI